MTTEQHPWQPFMPPEPRVLMLGTFPPGRHRWSMEFYYPNRINDMWRVMGLVFCGDKDALWDVSTNGFNLLAIKSLLTSYHIAMWDTAMEVRRLRDNASDKYLEIVRPIDLAALLDAHPSIAAVVTAGEKASGVVADLLGVEVPPIGKRVSGIIGSHPVAFYRMPSTSRAYPLPLERKADFYRQMFVETGVLS